MFLSLTAVVYTLLISSVLALPAHAPSYERKGRSFKVERVRNVNYAGRDGTAALIKAYKKWGMDLPSGLDIGLPLAKRHKIQEGAAGVNAALVSALGLGKGGSTGDTRGKGPAKTATVSQTHTIICYSFGQG